MNDARLVRFLTPWERRHPQLFAGMRIAGGVTQLIITALLYGYDRGGWWRVLLIAAAAENFYGAYRLPRAIRSTLHSSHAR